MKCWSRLSVGINIRSIFLFYYVLLMSIDRRAMWERTAYVMSPRFFDWKKSSTVVESFTSLIIGRYSFLMGKKKRKGDCKLNCENENDLSQITQWFIIRSTDYFDYAQMNEVNEMMCGRYETRCFDINKWRQASTTRSTAVTVEFLFPSRQ